jgi:hypothetical protein
MSNREFTAQRTMLANAFATAGAELLEYMGVSGALAAIPNTEPPQYVVAGTLPMIAKVLPPVSAVEQPTGDLPPLPFALYRDDTEHNVEYFTSENMRDYARAAIAAHLARQPKAEQPDTAVLLKTLESLTLSMDGRDQNQPGWHHRSGWNDALRRVMDVVRATAQATVAPAGAQIPAVIREAVEAAFEDREGWRTKISAAVRALGDAGAQNAEAIRNQEASEEVSAPEFDRKTDESEYSLVWELAKFSAPRQNGREFSESGLMMAVDFVRDQALEEAANALDLMNDSAGDRAAHEQRDMLCCETERMWTLISAAKAIRDLQTGSVNTQEGDSE